VDTPLGTGGEVCCLLVVIVPAQIQKKSILGKRTTTNGLTARQYCFRRFFELKKLMFLDGVTSL